MKWKINSDKISFDNIGISQKKWSEVLLKILSKRGLKNLGEIENFLKLDYQKNSHSPWLFQDMQKAVGRITQALEKHEKVAVFGDYDADGITASVILKETLEKVGLEVLVYIPDKKSEGYGMNSKAIQELAQKEIKLIITVDCGITGVKEVELARQLGLDVIITDHHHVPEKLPTALAIINPKVKDCGYPFSDLAGVGVAFKLAQALFEKLLPEELDQTKWFLDLVAIGTIADCVPLLDENRLFAKFGLLVLSKTKRIGLQQIFAVARLNIDENNLPTSRDVGFKIAPRINAAGRINHANLAYNLLVEKDIAAARVLALELEENNANRQKMTEAVTEKVKAMAADKFASKKFIFACQEDFPIGIVGLVAGKISDKFNKPAAVLQKGETESVGSFRSIPAVNIIEVIEKCSELLLKFGGHAQAAGISIKNENLEKFYQKMDSEIEKILDGQETDPELGIDVEVSSGDLNFELAAEIEQLRPFGEGNPEPILASRQMEIMEVRKMGSKENHLKLFLSGNSDDPKILEAIFFYKAGEFSHLQKGDIIDAAFNLQKDNWNGNQKIQLVLVDLRKE